MTWQIIRKRTSSFKMDIINANIFGNSLTKNQQNFISLEQSSYNYLIKLLKATNGDMFIEQYFILFQIDLVIYRSNYPELFCK